jgi:hypothetical protein
MNMTINETLWANHQYEILVSFIHHLAYWRCSHKEYGVGLVQELRFNDPGELPSLLKKLSGDLEERIEVGREARKTAMSHTWDHTAEAYESLFSRIAEKKRSEAPRQPSSRDA